MEHKPEIKADATPEARQLADLLYAARQARGYSQNDVASLVGVKQQQVSAWERGEWTPTHANLALLIDVLHIEPFLLWKAYSQAAQSIQASREAGAA